MFVIGWLVRAVIVWILTIMGLFIVPIALLFPNGGTSVSDGRPIIVLPDWAWLWSNDFDGASGDKRGWWNEHAPFGLGSKHFLSKFWWLAIRNPVNNLRRTRLFSCPVSKCYIDFVGQREVADKPGLTGWQFVTAEHERTEQTWHGFYGVWPWGQGRALVVRLGFKIHPAHEGTKEQPKGFCFRINPWKKI